MDIRRIVTPQLAQVLVWLAVVAAGVKALVACGRMFNNHSFSSLLVQSAIVFAMVSQAIGVLRRMVVSAILLAVFFAIGVAYRLAQGHGIGSVLEVSGLVFGAAAALAIQLYPARVHST
jgi:hypothetical protein